MANRRVLLLTGSPGVGKTTVVRKVAESLADRRVAGFITGEMRAGGARTGFRLTTFDGHDHVMANVNLPKTYRVGKYGVDVDAIDATVGQALTLDGDTDVYIVDEIGKMECLSRRFVTAVGTLLDSEKRLIATVAARGAGFIAEVKDRHDAEIWEVTTAHRDELPSAVLAWLARRLG